jgi:hypothetical protein
MLAVLIAMPMLQCYAGRIAQWSTSQASLEATGCCHLGKCLHCIAVAVATVNEFVVNTKTLTKQNF